LAQAANRWVNEQGIINENMKTREYYVKIQTKIKKCLTMPKTGFKMREGWKTFVRPNAGNRYTLCEIREIGFPEK
jgi:hypothetical protein